MNDLQRFAIRELIWVESPCVLAFWWMAGKAACPKSSTLPVTVYLLIDFSAWIAKTLECFTIYSHVIAILSLLIFLREPRVVKQPNRAIAGKHRCFLGSQLPSLFPPSSSRKKTNNVEVRDHSSSFQPLARWMSSSRNCSINFHRRFLAWLFLIRAKRNKNRRNEENFY
jgi:hypothetical protein